MSVRGSAADQVVLDSVTVVGNQGMTLRGVSVEISQNSLNFGTGGNDGFLTMDVERDGKLKMDQQALGELDDRNLLLVGLHSGSGMQLFDLSWITFNDGWRNAAKQFLNWALDFRHDNLEVDNQGVVTFIADDTFHDLLWKSGVTTWRVGGAAQWGEEQEEGSENLSAFYNGDNVTFAASDGGEHTITIPDVVEPGRITVRSGNFKFTKGVQGVIRAHEMNLWGGSTTTFSDVAITLDGGEGYTEAPDRANTAAQLTLEGSSV